MPKYSVIIPVYNRIDEVDDLLKSLSQQTFADFEVIIVEDGSSQPCDGVVKRYADSVDVKYFYKSNEGVQLRATTEWTAHRVNILYFRFRLCDSSGILRASRQGIGRASSRLLRRSGCRSRLVYSYPEGNQSFDDIVPYHRRHTWREDKSGKVYSAYVQYGIFAQGLRADRGFREMFSEDIDMSTRIRNAGFSIGLIHDAPVYHKRRVDFRKFMRQVYVFGMSRITLYLLYPDSLKLVHWLLRWLWQVA